MPRKTPAPTTEEAAMPAPPDTQDKLDMILVYLHRLDRRDRLRTWGGFLRGMLGLIPILLVLWSVWYFYAHGDEFLSKITEEAVKQSAAYMQGQ